MGEVVEATEKAIAAALEEKILTDKDAGAIETLRALAVKIDLADAYFDALMADATEHGSRPPSQDNVSIPTYLKYCESLGLTPAGRAKLAEKKPEGKGGKLGRLASVPKPA